MSEADRREILRSIERCTVKKVVQTGPEFVIQGAAVGGGLGLALTADFRIECAESRFSANFTRLGFHPGFGLSHTLPALVGQQHAAALFYTGQRIKGETAQQIGLLDRLGRASCRESGERDGVGETW